ncbi:hypothetical protein KY290_000300 [Solanum tuberosum]|uniref:DNA repair protein XRCC2 homolog n=1 Tax=Solanum tuberosum TaxID=4113 RepID=A0ABQ7WIY0_SOLTU|nr:hypothetical protein KY289_000311 [Solanum tuberosum]KAH0780702.1 hypothetical protein KY290_000300 [Solanum tuberosum]
MASSAREWIEADETAKQFLTRVFSERPFLPLPPPLHRIPLRPGNVVEIVGPSPSSKTRILMQASHIKQNSIYSFFFFISVQLHFVDANS